MSLKFTFLLLFGAFFTDPLPAQDFWAGFSSVEYDGEYFYAVANELFKVVKLDKSGKIVDEFGRRGRGPDEFSNPELELELMDDVIYVLDSRGMTLTLLRTQDFSIINKAVLPKPVSQIIKYRGELYGEVLNFEENNPFETGISEYDFRPISELEDPESALLSYTVPDLINPFYDSKIIVSDGLRIIVGLEGRNDFLLFDGKDSKWEKIIDIESRAIGKKIDGQTDVIDTPEARTFWKEKVLPSYVLVKSIQIYEGKAYFQVHSYKAGNSIIGYNFEFGKFFSVGNIDNDNKLRVKTT